MNGQQGPRYPMFGNAQHTMRPVFKNQTPGYIRMEGGVRNPPYLNPGNVHHDPRLQSMTPAAPNSSSSDSSRQMANLASYQTSVAHYGDQQERDILNTMGRFDTEYHEFENIHLNTPFKASFGLQSQFSEETPKTPVYATKTNPFTIGTKRKAGVPSDLGPNKKMCQEDEHVSEACTSSGISQAPIDSSTIPVKSKGKGEGKKSTKKSTAVAVEPKKKLTKKSTEAAGEPKKKTVKLIQCELCLASIANVKNHRLNYHKITQAVCLKPWNHDKKEKAYIYQCYHCLKIFEEGNDLRDCRISHGPHKCHHCEVTKKDLYDLYEHMRKKHNIENIKFECKMPNCDKVCTQKAWLTQHQIRVHGVGLTKDGDRDLYHCKTCLQTFKTRRNLQDHGERAEKNLEFCQAPQHDIDASSEEEEEEGSEEEESAPEESPNDGHDKEILEYSQKSSEGVL